MFKALEPKGEYSRLDTQIKCVSSERRDKGAPSSLLPLSNKNERGYLHGTSKAQSIYCQGGTSRFRGPYTAQGRQKRGERVTDRGAFGHAWPMTSRPTRAQRRPVSPAAVYLYCPIVSLSYQKYRASLTSKKIKTFRFPPMLHAPPMHLSLPARCGQRCLRSRAAPPTPSAT